MKLLDDTIQRMCPKKAAQPRCDTLVKLVLRRFFNIVATKNSRLECLNENLFKARKNQACDIGITLG